MIILTVEVRSCHVIGLHIRCFYGYKITRMTDPGAYTCHLRARFHTEKGHGTGRRSHLVILCGHYEGVDERVLEIVDEEISVGDYILTGGRYCSQYLQIVNWKTCSGRLSSEEAIMSIPCKWLA